MCACHRQGTCQTPPARLFTTTSRSRKSPTLPMRKLRPEEEEVINPKPNSSEATEAGFQSVPFDSRAHDLSEFLLCCLGVSDTNSCSS